MVIIGIDPHKGSHTAAVLDRSETVIGELRVSAVRRQRDRPLEFAADFPPRTWAIESASGLGALLAQQLVAAGETVLDVPPTLSARVRLLDAGCTDKTDPHDARAAAIVALRHVRRFDNQLVAINERIVEAVLATGTTVPDIHGIGPLGAAIILGHTGDIARFPSSGHYACYNASAPIAASSGPRQRHRLNPRGRCQLNRALHVAAVTQVRNDTQGRAYYRRKLDEGRSTKEALRALKRQIAKPVYRHLVADTHR